MLEHFTSVHEIVRSFLVQELLDAQNAPDQIVAGDNLNDENTLVSKVKKDYARRRVLTVCICAKEVVSVYNNLEQRQDHV